LRVIQTLSKNWWLLALCGVLEAIVSIIYLIMYDAGPDGMLFQGWRTEVALLCRLSVAAGVCIIAAGTWRPTNGIPWLVILNGLALSAYGLMPLLSKAPLGFNFFALLIVVMAMSFGVLALEVTRTGLYQQHRVGKWLLGVAGAASTGFALAFLALAGGWIQLERRPFHPAVFLWLCLFFAFSAVCMLGLALRLRRIGGSQFDPRRALSPIGNPQHAR